MNVKDYLRQGRLLEQRIRYQMKKLSELRESACSVSSPQYGRGGTGNGPNEDAPFVKALERIGEMEEEIRREIDLLAELKKQIEGVIRQADREEYQMTLIYRYREGMTWEQIGGMLFVDRSTAVRWHQKALAQLKMPEDAICVREEGRAG